MPQKPLTVENWTEADPANRAFGRLDTSTGAVAQMDGDDWARRFLAVELDSRVPDDLREMFDIARGACLYGWFFYPLYTVGQEHLFRISEAAAIERVRQLEGPELSNFKRAIDWLTAKDALREDHLHLWTSAKDLRNLSAHARSPQIHMPGDALRMLKSVAVQLNGLFEHV